MAFYAHVLYNVIILLIIFVGYIPMVCIYIYVFETQLFRCELCCSHEEEN